MPLKIAIGSINPTKYNAVRLACQKVFPKEKLQFICLEVESFVSNQPYDDSTRQGALNRAQNALIETNADIAIGLEGGIEKTSHGMFANNWCAVIDRNGRKNFASSCMVALPQKVAQIIETQQVELGQAIDMVLKKENTKQKEGFLGYISNNIIDRTSGAIPMIIFALAPFYNPEVFNDFSVEEPIIIEKKTPTPTPITLNPNNLSEKNSYSPQKPEYVSEMLVKEATIEINGHQERSTITTKPKKIYFSGTQTNQSSENINGLLSFLMNKHIILNQGQTNEPITQTDQFQKSAQHIKDCDIMIAEASEPNLNLGFEIAYALSKQKPVMALYKKNNSEHIASIVASQRNQLLHVYEYTDETLQSILNNILH